jgi:hypothetical protein
MDDMSASNLFRATAHLRFAPEQSVCPRCGGRLLVRKTRPREVVILDLGAFCAAETHSYCPAPDCAKSPVFRSEALQRLVAPGAKFGYDVMVQIGRGMFQGHRTAEEIVAELSARQVAISPSEVRVQARRFVLYLAAAHAESQTALKELLKKQGGYILHLDGTCAGAGAHLVSALDGVSALVLMSVKVEGENADEITPLLQKLKAIYGDPLAVVSDMSRAIQTAVTLVFKNIPHCVCHFHFLRDTGKDLMEDDYQNLREALRAQGICAVLRRRARELRAQLDPRIEVLESLLDNFTLGVLPAPDSEAFPSVLAYSMLEWALAGKQQGDGYGFPFDLPLVHFYDRLKVLSQALALLATACSGLAAAGRGLVARLSRDLQAVLDDPALQSSRKAIHQKKEVFDQLRQAMRLACPGEAEGLNAEGHKVDLPTIEKNVTGFFMQLQQRPDFTPEGPYGKMAAQIEKYWRQLFADPILVNTPQGTVVLCPNRTNNILERLFRALNRDHRRQTGENTMRRRLDAMLGDTPLVKNLDNPVYRDILLAGSPTLEERFARIDTREIRNAMKKARQEAGCTLPGLRKILSLPTWPLDVARLWIQTKTG